MQYKLQSILYRVKRAVLIFILPVLLSGHTCAQAQTDIELPSGFYSEEVFLNSCTIIIWPALALSPIKTIYIAYTDFDYDARLTVRKFDGSIWAPVGLLGFSSGIAAHPSLVLDTNGVPNVAYLEKEAKNNNLLFAVKKFSDDAWISVGPQYVFSSTIESVSLALDTVGTPYVAYTYRTSPNDYKLKVVKLSGNAWVSVGSSISIAKDGLTSSLVLDDAGTPYVAHVNIDDKLAVMKLEKDEWISVGTLETTSCKPCTPSLALSTSGEPYIAYSDRSRENRLSVMKLEKGVWVNVGKPGFSSEAAFFPALRLNADNVPYVAYMSSVVDNEKLIFSAMKLEKGVWVPAREPSATADKSPVPAKPSSH